jgi:hypothetical protein
MFDGPVRTHEENPLVWRIVTHDRGPSKPFNPFTDRLPPTTPAFSLNAGELPLVNRATTLHGTPLYASLLDDAPDVSAAIITAGGRLSSEEDRDPAAAAALRSLFEREPRLRAVYGGTR